MKSSTINFIKSVFTEDQRNSVAALFDNKKKLFDKEELNRIHLAIRGSKSVCRDNFITEVYKEFYSSHSNSTIVPDLTVPHVESWVPYVKGKTSIGVYNFFAANYGLKEPIYFRAIILDSTGPCHIDSWILCMDEVRHIQFEDEVSKEDGVILLQAFHPRIKVISNQLRYFGFYHGTDGALAAGVHSFPMASKTGYFDKVGTGYRSLSDKNEPLHYWNFSQHSIPLEPDDSYEKMTCFKNTIPLWGNGFLVNRDAKGCINSIWHDAPTVHSNPKKESFDKASGPVLSVFTVPYFEIFAPEILIYDNQIGFSSQKISIEIYSKDKLLADIFLDLPLEKLNSFNLKELFADKNIAGNVDVVVKFDSDFSEFYSNPACFLQIYYQKSSGQKADQVHSSHTVGPANDPFFKPKNYRCKKFAPLFINKSLAEECLYSIINWGPEKSNPTAPLKIRIITDKGEEIIAKRKVPDKGVLTISSREFEPELYGKIDSFAIFQIEHEATNFSANWFIVDSKREHLATDHFTGG